MNHCVRQGTGLGPFIFVPCVNYFSEAVSTNCDVLQCADDTSINDVSQNGIMVQLFVALFETGTHFQLQLE